jgi:hypothetical protein
LPLLQVHELGVCGAPLLKLKGAKLSGQTQQVEVTQVAEIEGAAPAAGESVIVEGMDGPKLKVRAA